MQPSHICNFISCLPGLFLKLKNENVLSINVTAVKSHITLTTNTEEDSNIQRSTYWRCSDYPELLHKLSRTC